MKNKKILITYYSRVGQNYVNGSIKNLSKGNTKVIAEMIQKHVGGDMFEIDTVESYPVDYMETTEVAKDELRARTRPALKNNIADVSAYDVVFVGYPNWWGTAPMAVFTFLEGHDFSGKTVIPFCTHEGSGLGSGPKDIGKSAKGSRVQSSWSIYGHKVGKADNDVKKWLDQLKL